MRGEIAIGGVFVPTLLILSLVALVLTYFVIQIANFAGLYRYVAYRALVDLCLYVFVLGLLAFLLPSFGVHP